MAIQSFYISIKISENEKTSITAQTNLKRCKKSNDLTYKDVLLINNITNDEGWWHINAGLYDFFHNCETLYEFCQAIQITKPNFTFYLLGEKYEFSFQSLLDFILFIYPKIENYKKNFEKSYGILSIPPNKIFSFRRKNKRYFK